MRNQQSSALQVLAAFLKLGLVSFGGPIAHLGYFRQQFVQRLGWLDDAEFAELVALCQFLPGPASSQVGIAIGLKCAGLRGALAAWLGFTLPSALLLVAFALHFDGPAALLRAPWVHGLLVATVAVVAQAVWTMGRQFCAARVPLLLALGAALMCLLAGGGLIQLLVLALAAALGWLLLAPSPAVPGSVPVRGQFSTDRAARRSGIVMLSLFVLLLLGLPLAAALSADHTLALVDRFFRTGSLVFGGGHVVLPLLQAQVVPPGWISNQSFLGGYAAAQAVPGPLFSFAAYLGAAMAPHPNGWAGAAICLAAIYLPAFLLVGGVLPFWALLRQRTGARGALAGINAAVVGVLLGALYNPVFLNAIHSAADFAVALAGFLMLQILRLPSWALLLLCAGYAVFSPAASSTG
jgi:chromate transporter